MKIEITLSIRESPAQREFREKVREYLPEAVEFLRRIVEDETVSRTQREKTARFLCRYKLD